MGGAWHRLLPWAAKSARDEEGDAIVRLLSEPSRPPATPEESRAVALLHDAGPLPFSTLVDRLARDMYADELRRGAWATDVGVLGATPFRAEAARIVTGAAGSLVSIDRQ